MISVIQNFDQDHQELELSLFNVFNVRRPSFTSFSLKEVLKQYGEDAFEPEIRIVKGIGADMVPRLRFQYSDSDWENLDINYRCFLMKSFYNNL